MTEVLLCIPPVSGSWDCYAAMRAAAQPGVELRSLVAGRDFAWREDSTIEQLAEGCAEYLRGVAAPMGLLGWSYGGLVAAECAAQLHDEGRPLRCLVLVDVMFPAELPEVVPRGHIVEMLIAFLAARIGVELDVATRSGLAAQAEKGEDALLDALHRRGLLRSTVDANRLAGLLARYERAIVQGNESLLRYSESGRSFDREIVERLLLLRASVAHPASNAWFAADPLAWRAIGRDAAVELVEGDHYSLIQSEGAASIATALARHFSP